MLIKNCKHFKVKLFDDSHQGGFNEFFLQRQLSKFDVAYVLRSNFSFILKEMQYEKY